MALLAALPDIDDGDFDFFKLFRFDQREKCRALIWPHGFLGSVKGKRILDFWQLG